MSLSIRTVKDLTVHPFVGRGARGGLLVEKEEDTAVLPHFRRLEDRLVNLIQPSDEMPADGQTVERLGEALFGGYFFYHFGHFLSETVPRLCPILADPRFATMPLLFRPVPMRGIDKPVPDFATSVLSLFGVDPGRIVVSHGPVRIDTLHVPVQGRGLGIGAVSSEYNSLMRQLGPEACNESAANIYLSRSRHLHSGGYFGESLMEERLARNGVRIIHPQDHPVSELLAIVRSARRIALAEGSAFHILELAGGLDADVLIVGRRDADFIRQRFTAPSRDIFRSLDVAAADRILPSLRVTRSGDPHPDKVCALHDLPALSQTLSSFFGIAPMHIDPQTARTGIVYDMGRWLLDPRTSGRTGPRDLGRLMREFGKSAHDAGILDHHRPYSHQSAAMPGMAVDVDRKE